jgi:translation initiation factor 1
MDLMYGLRNPNSTSLSLSNGRPGLSDSFGTYAGVDEDVIGNRVVRSLLLIESICATLVAEPGDEVFIPQGILHSVKNIASSTTHWLYGYDQASALKLASQGTCPKVRPGVASYWNELHMKEKKRLPTDGGPIKWASPFSSLKHTPLPTASPTQLASTPNAPVSSASKKNRGRVDILRQTAHRGGKTVTVVTGFVGIGQAEKEALAQRMQKACGAGGTVKDGRIEVQGDQREAVARILTDAGFRPVFAGG